MYIHCLCIFYVYMNIHLYIYIYIFRNVNWDLYVRTDGKAMGSPLGPLFANYYMCHIENTILPQLNHPPPSIYAWYVDDIFILSKNFATLDEIKTKFENFSVLKFTFEVETNKTLNCLDVKITKSENRLKTSVYTKPTNEGDCINFHSIAPERYKMGVVKTFLHRAYEICSDWTTFNTEIERIRQVLNNNNFPIATIDEEIRKFLDKKCSPGLVTTDDQETVTLFYKSQMTSAYKQEESSLHKIINENVTSAQGTKL